MAEKKKWAPTKMFLQWCLSYLLISVIALTLLLASGYRYLDVLRDNLEYTNGIQLDMTRVWLDQKVKLLRNITAKESSTAAIEAVRQADDYDDIPRYDYYMLTRKISTDVINYGIGDAYFLYFPSTDAIVSNTKYGQSRRFYDLVLEAYDISYEDWMEILKQNLVTTRVFQPVVQGKRHKGVIETEDTCDVFMTGPNGERLVFFCTNCYVKNAPVELEIVCENGSIRMVGNLVTTELDGKTETKDFSSGTVFGKDYWGSGHGFLIEDYYTKLAVGERFPVSGEEAIVSTRLLHAVYSSAKNHEVIRLDTKENQA